LRAIEAAAENDMSETWKRWEGRTVAGKFPLQRYLGGSDHSAVFLTLMQGEARDPVQAAIKLIPANAAGAEDQLLRWKTASELTHELAHPNLIRILAMGRCEVEGTELLYVVMEYAEENLSQILPERALTAEETRGMLAPVLRALQFVHDKGLVHGRIQPSNILAIGDQVKLSSDTLGVPGARSARAAGAYDPPEAAAGVISTAGDAWRLGMTLVEVLSQHLPTGDRVRVPGAMPEPFREIVEHCLQAGPGKRWTVAEISARLEGKQPASASPKTEIPLKVASAPATASRQKVSAKWTYLLLLLAVVAIAFLLIPRPKPPGPAGEVRLTPGEQGGAADNSQSAKAAPADTKASAATANESGVVQRVMPQVSPSARRTIQGTIKVRVRVEVDAAGNVAKAKLESEGPSKYFARAALEAAQGWKFSPAPAGESGPRVWKLQFAFTHAKTNASALRVRH
jgi:TonB family protein